METNEIILETDQMGYLKQMPVLPPNKQLAFVFKVLGDTRSEQACRKPHPDIFGKVTILGDIMETVPENDWNLPK